MTPPSKCEIIFLFAVKMISPLAITLEFIGAVADQTRNIVKNNKVNKFQKVKKTLSFIFNKQTKIQPEFIDNSLLPFHL